MNNIFLFTPNEMNSTENNKSSSSYSNLSFNLITFSYGLFGFGYVIFHTSRQAVIEKSKVKTVVIGF